MKPSQIYVVINAWITTQGLCHILRFRQYLDGGKESACSKQDGWSYARPCGSLCERETFILPEHWSKWILLTHHAVGIQLNQKDVLIRAFVNTGHNLFQSALLSVLTVFNDVFTVINITKLKMSLPFIKLAFVICWCPNCSLKRVFIWFCGSKVFLLDINRISMWQGKCKIAKTFSLWKNNREFHFG